MDLEGRTALVTGADAGSAGRSRWRTLGPTSPWAARPEQRRRPRRRDRGHGRRALRLAMDVRDLDQVRSAVASAVADLGRLDILVNNAGVTPANPAEADFDLLVQVNVKGTFFASQAAGRVMIDQGYGRIVNLGSQAGTVALPTTSGCCMTKAAIAHLTKCLAWSGAATGSPSIPWPRGTEPPWPTRRSAPRWRSGSPRCPRRRAGGRRRRVVFLASPAASLITGTTLLVDGGWTAR